MKPFCSLFLLGICCLFSCGKSDDDARQTEYYTEEDKDILRPLLTLPLDQPDSYIYSFPSYIEEEGYRFNTTKATLGRVLFYDKKLSESATVSCASCHKQAHAFGDSKAFSENFSGGQSPRNSYALASTILPWHQYLEGGPSIFWDNRFRRPIDAIKAHLEDSTIMGGNLAARIAVLEGIDYYQVLTTKAYWLDAFNGQVALNLNVDRAVECLIEFTNAIASINTPFDRAYEGQSAEDFDLREEVSAFSQSENRGKSLFATHCASCHGIDFAIPEQREACNGLEIEYQDKGIGMIARAKHPASIGGVAYNGVFKVPTLRNIQLSAPYMHDGRFTSLEEVIDHYSDGIQNHRNLDIKLKDENGQAIRLDLSDAEKADLIAFLKTLTDDDLATAQRFSDPFR